MRLPSKVTSYRESVLPKFPKILAILKEKDITPCDLYKKVKKYFDDICEFIEILDCLFLLEKIEFIEESGVLHYVEGNDV